MSTYRRSGHWRTSKNGNTHWVSGHDVSRSSWSSPPPTFRWAPSSGPPSPVVPTAIPAEVQTARPARATLVGPNATCPVCGASVYFYSNAAGSKVYFDDLGPPWPKHPCMDLRARRGNVSEWKPTPEFARLVARPDEYQVPQGVPTSMVGQPRSLHGEVVEWRVRWVDHLPNGSHLQLSRQWPNGPRSWWFTPYLVRVHLMQPVFSVHHFGRFATFSYVDIETLEVNTASAHRTRASLGEHLHSWRHRRR